LKFPKGYSDDPEKIKQRLISESVVYDVELVDFIERIDLEANGNFFKYFEIKPENKEWQCPSDQDEIIFSYSI
jgi:hypothetical protein